MPKSEYSLMKWNGKKWTIVNSYRRVSEDSKLSPKEHALRDLMTYRLAYQKIGERYAVWDSNGDEVIPEGTITNES